MLRMLQDRKNRASFKKQGYDKALAECHNNNKPSSTKKSSTGVSRKSGGIQTGLHAFFKATKAVSKKEKVIDLSEEEADSATSGSNTGKRKESASPSEAGSPPKKSKGTAPAVKVVPGKRNSGSPVSCTPEKKLRTVVNADGVIELVTVPR